MEEKRMSSILGEFLLGTILMLPFIIDQKIQYIDIKWLMVIVKALFSVGLPLTMLKMMSVLYKIFSHILKNKMTEKEILYKVFYVLFIIIGIVIWRKNLTVFKNGYGWVEIIAYIIFAVWFMMDVNTIECSRVIKQQRENLKNVLDVHKQCVMEYKENMHEILKRQESMLEELSIYSSKSFWNDPLKVFKKEINFSYIDNYEKSIPQYKGLWDSGLSGLVAGRTEVMTYRWKVEDFLRTLYTDENRMRDEVQEYDQIIKNIEIRIKSTTYTEDEIIDTVNNINDTLKKIGHKGVKIERTKANRQQDVKDTIKQIEDNKGSIKNFWKMNKRYTRERRKNYGR